MENELSQYVCTYIKDGKVYQYVEGAVVECTRQVHNTKDKQFVEALKLMGWTPPKRKRWWQIWK